ncbi:MAG: ABC transporter permease, partial [Bryobacterales bacterium]
TALPDSLSQLSQLQSLDLSRNQLTALPDSLSQLSQLQHLVLIGNQLTALPDSLSQLSQLQSLDLGSNQLTALRFTAIAVLTLALAIGANTAIFSIVHAVLLRSLPYRDPGRLVRVWETAPPTRPSFDRVPVSVANLLSWGADADLFEEIAACNSGRNATVTLTGSEAPVKLLADGVHGPFFRMLGVEPILGRVFLPEDEQPGRDQVVLLSYELWQRQFGGDAAIVGQSVTLDGHSH